MEIKMPRGDIHHVRFTVTDANGAVSPIQFTEIYVTFKKSFSDKEYLFQKKLSDGSIVKMTDDSYQFIIEPEDTDELQIASYVFDIELIYEDEIKQTTVGRFTLTNEVTFAINEVGSGEE